MGDRRSPTGNEIAPDARYVMPPVGVTKTVTTKDGRRLAYMEAGDPNGPLFIHNHGGPSSRYEALLLASSAAANRLRLICVDRPGMGQSSAQIPRTYFDWAKDLVTMADALGYPNFGVTGWSEGGPWALAAAAYIDPSRLCHISSIAGGSYGTFGNDWAAEYLAAADKLGGFLALHMRPGFRLMYAALDLAAKRFPDSFYTALKKAANPYDREILERPGFEEVFMQGIAECFAHGADGLVRDAEVFYRQ
jgi:pimeloyl-ACP methyl ester carboxylesterase